MRTTVRQPTGVLGERQVDVTSLRLREHAIEPSFTLISGTIVRIESLCLHGFRRSHAAWRNIEAARSPFRQTTPGDKSPVLRGARDQCKSRQRGQQLQLASAPQSDSRRSPIMAAENHDHSPTRLHTPSRHPQMCVQQCRAARVHRRSMGAVHELATPTPTR